MASVFSILPKAVPPLGFEIVKTMQPCAGLISIFQPIASAIAILICSFVIILLSPPLKIPNNIQFNQLTKPLILQRFVIHAISTWNGFRLVVPWHVASGFEMA